MGSDVKVGSDVWHEIMADRDQRLRDDWLQELWEADNPSCEICSKPVAIEFEWWYEAKNYNSRESYVICKECHDEPDNKNEIASLEGDEEE